MINSFQVNIDTSDINHTTHNKDSGVEVDLTQGEIKYVKENYEASVATLEREEKNLETLASVLDSQNHEEWDETKEIATTYDLNLIKEDYRTLEYKDKLSEGGNSVSKYSYLRHLSKTTGYIFYTKRQS